MKKLDLEKKLIFITLSAFAVILSILFFNLNYYEFINFLKTKHHDIYDIDNIEAHFSKHRFLISQFALLLLSFCLFASSILLPSITSIYQSIIHLLKTSIAYTKNILYVYKELTPFQKNATFVVFFIILSHRILNLYYFPLDEDELFSYVFFVKQDFWICLIYYPEPNNHIFFNLICNFFDLFISDPLLCMRIPSLILYILSLVLIFTFCKKNFGFITAILSLILCGFSCGLIYYSIQGRGYITMSFFTLVAFFSIIQYCKYPSQKFFLKTFIIASVLGAYTIPVFLFPFIAILSYGLITEHRNKMVLKNILYASFLVSILVFALYLPIILLNGIESLTNNKWVSSRGLSYLFKILPAAVAESIDYMIGTTKKGYLIILVCMLVCFIFLKKNIFNKVEKKWLLLFIISLASAFLILIAIKNFPPYRVWTYLIFIFNIYLAILIGKLINRLPNLKFQQSILLAISVAYSLLMINQCVLSEEEIIAYKDLEQDIEKIYHREAKNIFIDKHDLIEVRLRLEYIKHKKTPAIDSKRKNGKEYDLMVIYNNPPKDINFDKYKKTKSNLDNALILKK